MSHFKVTVFLEPPMGNVEDRVSALLAPFHEFECTGRDDQYVKDIDETADAMKQYRSHKTRMAVLPDGSRLCAFDDRFYRLPTPAEKKEIGPIAGTGGNGKLSWSSRDWGDGLGYQTRVRDLGDAKEVEVPTSETQTFREFCEDWYGREVVGPNDTLDLEKTHKYGHIRVDENGNVLAVMDRTNPNRKWDWWVIGGRWDRDLIGDRTRGSNNPHGGESDTGGNVVPVSEVREDYTSFAFLTPSGEWIERGSMGWWGAASNETDEAAWAECCKTIMANHRHCIAVTVDCHI